ncbi:hypothetical protein GCM10010218_07830 [Streptomyces mashuensis]|uniref:Uncharacterized protein n=1 Tax=Streptomyces mashuensis TaxID=33904 RepID=A0A919AY46_9ACTN|nr:hypothetical protein [Streptomyces mashuensis]GHF29108.1 hypothetical protein GCM10010218_07830 [Streptomyces mashuensis]
MVDPVSLDAVTTAVSAAAGAAGTEAGRQVWGGLVRLARRAAGRGGPEEEPADLAPLPSDPADATQVQALAALVFGRAFQDPDFAAEFRSWAEQARTVVSVGEGAVTNIVSGRARTVLQGRDFKDVHLGP